MTGREALVFLIALAAASTLFITTCRADDPRVIHIQGKVVCTDCSKDWNEWVNGAKPLQGMYSLMLPIYWFVCLFGIRRI